MTSPRFVRSLMILMFVVFCRLAYTQAEVSQPGRQVNLWITRFEMKGGASTYRYLDSALPKSLAERVNKSEEFGMNAEPTSDFDIDKHAGDSAYLITGKFWERDSTVHVEGEVACVGTKKTKFYVSAKAMPKEAREEFREIEDLLARQLFEDLVIGFKRNVRIGITRFHLTGGDRSLRHFEESIPKMLGTDLGVSSKLILIEADTVELKLRGRERHSGIWDSRTAVEVGKLLIANYLIMGELWEHGGKMRIDVRCVSVETGQTIVSHGINFESIDIDTISSRMEELASGTRSSIIQDLVKRDVGKTMSVVGLPPLPNTADNRKRTLHVVRALSKKLKALDVSVIVKEDEEKVELFVGKATDRWRMAAELDVDKLLAVQYEDYGEGKITIYADVFDAENPSVPIYSDAKHGHCDDVDGIVNSIVKGSMIGLGEIRDTISDSCVREMGNIHVRRVVRSNSLAMAYGLVFSNREGPLESDFNSAFALSASFPLFYLSQSRLLKLMPLVSWDWGSGTYEYVTGTPMPNVHLLSIFLTAKAGFLPVGKLNPYAGLGPGVLLLRRIRREAKSILDAPGGEFKVGFTLLGELEWKPVSNGPWSVVLSGKWFGAVGEFGVMTCDGLVFNGGGLSGASVGLGVGYNW